MSPDAWQAMVQRYERLAAERPGRYRLRVRAVSALAPAFLAAVVSVVALAIAGIVVDAHALLLVKLIVPLLALLATLLRSLPVRVPPPDGIALSPAEAPQVWSLVERTREALGSGPVHEIRIDGDLNAAAALVPRFGFAGPSRSYLVLGLPLLEALSPEEAQAVVAHELGHLGRRHGRSGARVYRSWERWRRLLEALRAQHGWSSALFLRFFSWYAPRFDTATTVLRRRHEHEADAASVRVAGAATAARALAALRAAGRAERAYWHALWSAADAQGAPPADAYAAYLGALPQGRRGQGAREALDEALAEQPQPGASHPTLAQRLEAMGASRAEAEAALAGPPADTAAERYLGALAPRLRAALEQRWQERAAAPWRERHDEAGAARARLEELVQAAAGRALSLEEAREQVALDERLGSAERATASARGHLERWPEDAPLRFLLGRLLLAAGDDAGLAELERAMALDPVAVLAGCRLAYEHLLRRRRAEEAAAYRRRAVERQELLARARAERARAVAAAQLEAHELEPAAVAALKHQLASCPGVRRAYLARRRLRHDVAGEPDEHLLVVVPRLHPRYLPARQRALLAREVAGRATAVRPLTVVCAGPLDARLRRARSLAGAALEPRRDAAPARRAIPAGR